jgi:hypothetical protein
MNEPPKEAALRPGENRSAVDEATPTVGTVKAGYLLARKPRPRKGELEADNQTHWLKTARQGAVSWLSNGRRSAQ